MAELTLPEVLTRHEAPALLERLGDALRAGGDSIQVDAGALRQLDTSAIALLLECRRRADERGLGFELRDAPPHLGELASLYGVAGLLGLAHERSGSGPPGEPQSPPT